MYKPIPFFMSNRGYGMFVHSSSPMTFDMGASFHAANNLLVGDDDLDLFVFLGEPKDILDEYTNLTGKAAMPPLWSFGLWMSRITYLSEDQVRTVAAKRRQNRIPDDVIHIDTGWPWTWAARGGTLGLPASKTRDRACCRPRRRDREPDLARIPDPSGSGVRGLDAGRRPYRPWKISPAIAAQVSDTRRQSCHWG